MRIDTLRSTLSIALSFALVLVSVVAVSAPGDILFENYFSSNGDLNSDWSRSSNAVTVNNTYFSSPGSSVRIPAGESITLKVDQAIDAAVPAAELAVWVQRGESGLFPYPETGDDLAAQYLNDQGNWLTLEVFPGGGPAEEEFQRTYDLPADALHSALRLRFVNTSPSGFSNADYWYVDDVVVTERAPVVALVGHWQMDESGWDGTAGEVLDNSGNGNHGTANGGATTANTDPAVAGDPGTCRYGEFDGVDDYIDAGSISATLNATASMAFWIRTTQSGNDTGWMAPGVAGVEENGGADDIFWGWLDASGRIGLSVGNDYSTKSSVAVNDGSWHHVVLTRNHVAGTYGIYIDGSLNDSGTIATGVIGNGYSSIGRIEDTGGSPEYFAGQLDEVRIYDGVLSLAQVQAVMAETHACPNYLDHYGVSYDGGASYSDATGITCEAASVTITAHDSADNLIAPASGTTITIATSTGIGYWSNPDVGTVTDGGNGNATYTFAGNDIVTLQFNHPQLAVDPIPVNININSGTGDPTEIAGEDPNIQFFDTGFRFVDAADNPVIATQVAAQESAAYFLQAVRTDTQTGSCVNVFADGATVNLELAAECNDPLACAGQQLAFTNNGNTVNLATNDNNGGVGASAYSTVANVLFGSDSKANFTVNYPDVGAVSLHARYQIENDDGSASGYFMLGSSNGFIVRPANFVITTVDAGATNNPGTTGGGSGFVASGDPFRVVVEARNAAGNLTPNYGNEVNPEGLAIAIDGLSFPAGGNPGVLANGSSFNSTSTAGEFENTIVSWSEVGTFTALVAVADGDYLGTGNVTGTVSGNIGRFYPADFSLLSSTVANSCVVGGFTYLSDPSATVSYQLQARNRGGAVVSNYDNADLSYPGATVSVHAENNNDGTDLVSRVGVVSGLWDDGVLSVSDSNAMVARVLDGSLNTVPDGPLTNVVVGLQVADMDGANFVNLDFKPDASNNCVADGDCDSVALSGNFNLRFGRLALQDVHGPESAPIPMVWQTQYWNGSQFVTNSNDQCTQLPLSAVNFVGATTSVDALNDTISVDNGGVTSVFNFADPSGGDDCLTAANIGICDGQAGTFYGATNAVVTYPIDIDLSGLSFLQGDWNQDGNYNDASHPRVYVRFEHYRGHDRVIYWRERLQ